MDNHTRDEQVRRDPGVRLLETNRPVYAVEGVDVRLIEEPFRFPMHTKTASWKELVCLRRKVPRHFSRAVLLSIEHHVRRSESEAKCQDISVGQSY
jgi:hypothetical protein